MKRICYLLALCAILPVLCSASLKKSVTWENIKAHPAPLPVIGELVPVHSSLDADSWWSVGSETLDRDFADFSKYKQYMGETGVGYARLQSGWAKTEKKKGKYDFAWLDEHVNGLLEEGIHPWICLCYGNPVWSEHGTNLGARIFPGDGPVMDAWLRYVKAIVTRYKGKVTMWEVWNEPDGGKNGESYGEYATLFVRTAKLIKELDPEARVAGFGVCSPHKVYIRKAMEIIDREGGVPYMDYLTYHAYWGTPEKIIPAVKKLRKDLDAYSTSIQLLQGETGCPAQLEYGHALHDAEWTEYSQAKWDLRQSLTHFGMGIPYSFFTMVDLNYGWMLQSFGLIRMNGRKEPVYKRPKFYAVQHVTSVFSSEMKTGGPATVECSLGADLTAFYIENNGKKVGFMLWLSGDRPGSSLERRLADIRIAGLKLKDPVYVDMLTGKVHDLAGISSPTRSTTPEMGFKGFPVWDCPVLVIERSKINYNKL